VIVLANNKFGNNPTKRYVIRLSELMGKYFEDRAIKVGQPVSAVMSMALAEYLEQKQGLDVLSGLMAAVKIEQAKKDNLLKAEVPFPSPLI
jgi:hypothetical protein